MNFNLKEEDFKFITIGLIPAFFIMYLASSSIGNAFAELTKSSLESIENILAN